MDFAFDESQRAVADLTAEVLRRSDGSAEAAWKGLAQAGLLGLAVPESVGGAGLGVLETGIVLAEAGRRAAELPALATLALGVLPLARCGTTAQQEQVLPGVLAGEHLLTAALNEPGDPLPAAPRTTATPDGDGFRLTGRKVGVPYAEQARHLLAPATLAGGGTGVFLLDPGADGVTLTRTPASATTPEYTLVLDGARATGQLGPNAVETLYAHALAGACAYGDGLLQGALDLTTAHLRTRHQFGKPLATFQAVAQQIADVYIAGRTLGLLARSAAWRLAEGLDADEDLAVAGYWLAEELPAALYTCHHLHGGLGVDVDYPLHRYSAQARDLARLVGGVDDRLTRLGAQCTSN